MLHDQQGDPEKEPFISTKLSEKSLDKNSFDVELTDL